VELRLLDLTTQVELAAFDDPAFNDEDDLRRRFSVGEWEPGERLPAVAELAQHYSVARNTVIKALRRLADDGTGRDRAELGNVPGAELGKPRTLGALTGKHPQAAQSLDSPIQPRHEQWPPS